MWGELEWRGSAGGQASFHLPGLMTFVFQRLRPLPLSLASAASPLLPAHPHLKHSVLTYLFIGFPHWNVSIMSARTGTLGDFVRWLYP